MTEYNEKNNDAKPLSQRNAVTVNGGKCSYKEYLGEQELFDEKSNSNALTMLPNPLQNVLVPLSKLKKIINSNTVKSSQEVSILAPNTNYDESSRTQKTDSSNSQTFKRPISNSKRNSFASKSKTPESDHIWLEDHDCLLFARNNNIEENYVGENSQSKSLNKGKVAPKNVNTKLISRDKFCSRNKLKSRKHQSKEDNRSKHAQQDGTMIESCKVCGDIASTHIHYGGRSCQSCRAFFRRSVVKFSK